MRDILGVNNAFGSVKVYMVKAGVACTSSLASPGIWGDRKQHTKAIKINVSVYVQGEMDISFSFGQWEKDISFSYGETIRDISFSCGHYHVQLQAVKDI